MYRMTDQVVKVARDVESLGNTVPSKPQSVKGSLSPTSQSSFLLLQNLAPGAAADHDRGPSVGFKKRRHTGSSTDHTLVQVQESPSTPTPPLPIIAPSPPTSPLPAKSFEAQVTSPSRPPSADSSFQRSRLGSRIPPGRDVPLLGLPRPMIDELLAVYFTHVHVSQVGRMKRYR
jgi:hypothetical protein